MIGNKVESVKIIGQREMNMNADLKSLFDKSDRYISRPYFNDAKETLNIFDNLQIR